MEIPKWWFQYPLEKKLEEEGYCKNYKKIYFPPVDDDLTKIYGKFEGGELIFPEGISGTKLWEMRKKLQDEYKKIENNTGEEEIKKRGAGYNFKT